MAVWRANAGAPGVPIKAWAAVATPATAAEFTTFNSNDCLNVSSSTNCVYFVTAQVVLSNAAAGSRFGTGGNGFGVDYSVNCMLTAVQDGTVSNSIPTFSSVPEATQTNNGRGGVSATYNGYATINVQGFFTMTAGAPILSVTCEASDPNFAFGTTNRGVTTYNVSVVAASMAATPVGGVQP